MENSMKFPVGNKIVELYGEDSRILVLTIAEHGEGAELYEECLKQGCKNFTLAAIDGVDWNLDLSPWKAEPVFKKGEPFGGGADKFLEELEKEILPGILKRLPGNVEKQIFAGYSLAGLLAFYSGYKTKLFQALVSASGSLWFPGFSDYVKTHELEPEIQAVYFSLGDQEAKTRNPLMQKVEENTREISEYLAEKGIRTTFELNPGNHFVDDCKRLAKGIRWILG